MQFDEIENAIGKVFNSLDVVRFQPDENEKYKIINFDNDVKDNSKWRAIIKEYLKCAKTFEIHCFNEEEKWIKLALKFGKLKESDWQYGKVIFGEAVDEFEEMILSIPKPEDTEVYNKMTPFFSIFLDSGFSSSHYGTEIYLK